ncbi:unnamed protein product, partial [Rotaria magnacalcarata]
MPTGSLQSIALQLDYEKKLDQCCQRLDHLSSKVDRIINLEQS